MYSAWKIWWHPRLTRRVMEDLEHQLEVAKTEVERSQSIEEQTKESAIKSDAEIEMLRAEVKGLNSEIARLTEQNGKLSSEVDSLRAELNEAAEVENRLKEFEELVTRVEEMKQRYESRIRKLREAVSKLQLARNSEDFKPAIPVELELPPDETWLEPLPDK